MKIRLLRTFKVIDSETGEEGLLLKGTELTDEVTDIDPEIMLEVTEPRPDCKTVEVLDPKPSKRAMAELEGGDSPSNSDSEGDSTSPPVAAAKAKAPAKRNKAAAPAKKTK